MGARHGAVFPEGARDKLGEIKIAGPDGVSGAHTEAAFRFRWAYVKRCAKNVTAAATVSVD
jgi:hypothetical protein